MDYSAEVEDCVQRIRDAKAQIESEKERLRDIVAGLPGRLENRDCLIDAATYLYWEVPEVTVESIPLAVTGKSFASGLLTIIPKRHAAPCKGCDNTIMRNSRSAAVPDFCPDCIKRFHAQRNAESDARVEQWKARRELLRTMPYREYLATPEWHETRMARLKSARFSCQVCNASRVRLNVHHRTYERRGNELAGDLIVLCEDCHSLFHEQGKLAQEN